AHRRRRRHLRGPRPGRLPAGPAAERRRLAGLRPLDRRHHLRAADLLPARPAARPARQAAPARRGGRLGCLWHVVVLINLYAVLALSLNLVVGYTGLPSLCHAAFYGIGAYTSALLSPWLGFFPALLAAVGLTALLSLLVAVPSLRLR